MVKMPDFSEFSKKVNLQSMIDNVKSAIGTAAATPGARKVLEGDELVAKFSDIMNLMGNLSDMNAQQAKAIANISAKIHELDRDIQAMKVVAATCAEVQKHSNSATEVVMNTTEVKITPKVGKPKVEKSEKE